jgi:hypothetical protein
MPDPSPVDTRVLIEDVIVAVAEESGHTRDEIVSDRRQRSLVIARQVAMHLSRAHTLRSLTEIGRRLRRDHTTVIFGIQAHQRRAQSDPAVRDLAERAVVRLRQRVADRVRQCTIACQSAYQGGRPMVPMAASPVRPLPARDGSGPRRDAAADRLMQPSSDVPPDIRAWFAANDARFRAHLEQLACAGEAA